jgi:spore coat protein U-like protein
MTRKLGIRAGFLSGLIFSASVLSPLLASTMTSTFAVTTTITAGGCSSISAGPLSFGALPAAPNPGFATTTVSVTCLSGNAYTITGSGTNPVATCPGNTNYFVMGPAPATTGYPYYALYKDSGHSAQLTTTGTTCAGSGASAISGTGTGSAQTFTIYGAAVATFPGNPATPSGSYTDTATLVLTF